MSYIMQEHREGLVKLYKNQKREAGPFMTATLKEALSRLNNGAHPGDVENFVVDIEKRWRKL